MMEGLSFTPEEQEYYSELFTRYDVEKTGKLTTNQAMVLFLSSQVPTNQLIKISDLCGAERVGQYGRSQFFIALKLIAMVQSGKPLPKSLDSIGSGLEVPLPQFGENVEEMGTEFENPGFLSSNRDAEINRVNGGGFPPPPQASRAGITSNIILHSIDERDGSSPKDDSLSSSPPASPDPQSPVSSPSEEPLSPISGLPRQQSLPAASTPMSKAAHKPKKQMSVPHHVGEEGWAEFEKTRSQVSHNTSEMDNSWATFPPPVEETAEENGIDEKVDVQEETKTKAEEVVEEDTDDPWVITKEQKKYYTAQFQKLQPDISQVIKGPEAKAFFEKSKLPTYELSQIWQLSDVNKDGTLYLEEFCTAMHLVVLRKHQISLPEKLPQNLIPKIGDSEATKPPEAESSTIVITPLNSRKHSGRSITPPSSGSEAKQDENWATFQDSPFPGPPTPSTQTPVNFDFASISPDPDAKIFQPIPVHLAPDGKPLPEGEQSGERPRTFSDPLKLERQEEPGSPRSPGKIRSLTHADKTDSTPTIAPPPSAGKRRSQQPDGQDLHEVVPPPPRSRSRSYHGPTLRSQLQQAQLPTWLSRQQAVVEESEGNMSLPVGTVDPTEEPSAPAPPPRKSGHNRAASLDLNAMLATEPGRMNPPLIPPRPGAQAQDSNVQYTNTPKRTMSVDERKIQKADKPPEHLASKDSENTEKEGPPQLPPRPNLPEEILQEVFQSKGSERHHSVDLEDDDKEKTDTKQDRRRHQSAPSSSSKKRVKPKDRLAIQAAIRAAKEDNVKLSRLNNELHQELGQITEDRAALQAQLQKLKPFQKVSDS